MCLWGLFQSGGSEDVGQLLEDCVKGQVLGVVIDGFS